MRKVEQNWVVMVESQNGIKIMGTRSGGAMTRNGAWIQEREMQLSNSDPTVKITAMKLEKYEGESNE